MKRAIILSLSLAAAAGWAIVLFFGSEGYQAPTGPIASSTSDVSAPRETSLEPLKKNIAERYGELPMQFEPNVGQAETDAAFFAHGRGYSLALRPDTATLALRTKGNRPATISMKIDAADANAKAIGESPSSSRTNYIIGNDPSKWQTDVANFRKVRFTEIYPGVDVVYYGNGKHLEYDFVVAPEADPGRIRLRFEDVRSISLEKRTGDLLLKTDAGQIRQMKPVAYQMSGDERLEIAANYKLSDGMVSISLGAYDTSRQLIIDPILSYGSYLGGTTFDEGRGVSVDGSGHAYVVGTAASLDFPTTPGALKSRLQSRTDAPNSYWYDAFVAKVNQDGTALVYSTYFGGRSGSESGSAAAVDKDGNVVLAGTTMSTDLPVANAVQSTFGGTDDGFVAKLNAAGNGLIYSTYLGGYSSDFGGRIGLDRASGDTVVAGITGSTNFPTTPGVYRPRTCDQPKGCTGVYFSGSYVVKLNANGGLVYSTLFDASIADVALEAGGNAVVGGTATRYFLTTPSSVQPTWSGGVEGFIAKLDATGSSLPFATFLGGGAQSDRVRAVATDATGNIYAAGTTENIGFPTTSGAFDRTFNGGHDGFVTKIDPQGSTFVYSTFLGGTGKDEVFGLDVAGDGSPFVSGETTGPLSFPLKNSLNGLSGTIFVTRFTPAADALVYSTMLGLGGAYDLAVDPANNAYATGHTTSVVATPNSFQPMNGEASAAASTKDAFIVKLGSTDESAALYSISGVVTDPTQSTDYAPITVTLSGTVSRSIKLPYGNGSGNIPYTFGALPAGGNYTVTVNKIGHLATPTNAVFNNLGANQFADFTILDNQAPEATITAPASDTTYDLPANIEIKANASDPDGNGIAKVEFFAYPVYATGQPTINIGVDTTAPYSVTWSNAPAGTYSIYAVPTDGLGRRGFSNSTVVHTVDVSNPNVVLISPANGTTVKAGAFVRLDSSVSSSVTLLEYYAGTELIGRRTGPSYWVVDWRPMMPGTFNIYAKAYLANGQSFTSNSVDVNVLPVNPTFSGRITESLYHTPLSDIEVRITGTNNSISATTFTDADGRYSFANLGAKPEDGFTITAFSSVYNFTPNPISISYVGYIDWDYQHFNGKPITGITTSLTAPFEGQIFSAPASIRIAADATSTAGAISKVEFVRRNIDASVSVLGTDTEAPYEFDWTNVGPGEYFVLAQVTDATGAVAHSNTSRITVNGQPNTIRLQGDIWDPYGSPMQGIIVDLTGTVNGSTITQTSTSFMTGAYGFFNLPAGGTYTITPRVEGAREFSPPSRKFAAVTSDNYDVDFWSSTPNTSPTVEINSPQDGAVYTMPAVIPIDVQASDSDGRIIHLTVGAQTSDRGFTLGQTNNGTFTAPWQPNLPGEYRIYAQARDNGGFLTTRSINITVVQPQPATVSGRVVDRNSVGIEGVALVMRDYPDGNNVIGTATTDSEGNYSITNVTTFKNYAITPAKESYLFSPQQRLLLNLQGNRSDADFTATLQVQTADFNGDGSTDYSVYRPETGAWNTQTGTGTRSSRSPFGRAMGGDIPVPGNYDGDKRIDPAIFRGGTWLIRNSSDGLVRDLTLGEPGDVPVPADYDGDGTTDLAVWRGSAAVLFIRSSLNGTVVAEGLGAAGDIPLAGDFDGDGLADRSAWRPSQGMFYILHAAGSARNVRLGDEGDKPLVGDFDGDKIADPAVFTASSGLWKIVESSTGATKTVEWGGPADIAIPGDYDNDGKTDVAFFRRETREWFIYQSSTGSYSVRVFGRGNDVPIPSLFIR